MALIHTLYSFLKIKRRLGHIQTNAIKIPHRPSIPIQTMRAHVDPRQYFLLQRLQGSDS